MNTNQPSSLSRYAWAVVALLWPVALLNYLDRQMLATMKASMVGDIPTIGNKADWGLILGCFKWTYAIVSPLGVPSQGPKRLFRQQREPHQRHQPWAGPASSARTRR